MQRRTGKFTLAILLLFVSTAVFGQESSLNTFSPYTFYGLGDIAQTGTAQTHSMGSIGVAMRSPVHLNYSNPAAFSAAPKQSFLMNFGMQGSNFYLKNSSSKTSYNTFNMHDVGLMFPIYKKLGFGLSITPYSNVGYRTVKEESDPDILAELGKVQYSYLGQGGLNELKAGVGMEIFKGFSLGVNFIYYLGTVDRYAYTSITNMVTGSTYRQTSITKNTSINKINTSIGVQYQYAFNDLRNITFGATYQPKLRLNPQEDVVTEVTNGITGDSVSVDNNTLSMIMPAKFVAGVFYQTRKIGVGIDYSYQDWANAFSIDPKDNVQLTNYQDIKLGFEYTPDRYNVRSLMRRTSYRLGARYNNSYMMKNNHKIQEYAITAGVGVPLRKSGWTSLNAGIEFGRRGTTKNNLIQENFFRVFVGFSLFGEDLWFVKPKFD